MKAAMDENGVITITAENAMEAFALRQWVEMADASFTKPGDDWPTGRWDADYLCIKAEVDP